MTPRQARRILRESTRRERRDTFRGLYKYTVDGGRTHFTIDAAGIPHQVLGPPLWIGYDESTTITPAMFDDVRQRIAAEWLGHA